MDDDNEYTMSVTQIPAPEARYRADVLVCGGTGCTSSNSQQVFAALKAEVNGAAWAAKCGWCRPAAVASARWAR